MSHYYEECECGKYLGGCRCPDMNKAKRVVSPCVHEDSETGELQEDPDYTPKHMAMRGIDG